MFTARDVMIHPLVFKKVIFVYRIYEFIFNCLLRKNDDEGGDVDGMQKVIEYLDTLYEKMCRMQNQICSIKNVMIYSVFASKGIERS